ncbi:hypothetical protein [Micromonospora tulbaghiae]|uniref:hypothetical protein n=1 Tax=Micromonospora TaxID=1873 RepID=UPI001FD62A5A|nr:hypothetical protein [Micromonospora tulbaghiae]
MAVKIMRRFSEGELKAVVATYEAGRTAALTERGEQLWVFDTSSWRAVDLQRVTGYTQEAIRPALRPEVRRVTNISRRRTSPQPPADYRTYGDRKPTWWPNPAALHGRPTAW